MSKSPSHPLEGKATQQRALEQWGNHGFPELQLPKLWLVACFTLQNTDLLNHNLDWLIWHTHKNPFES